MILRAKNAFTIQWTLTDDQTPPQPVNNATMTATLYAGRSAGNPNAVPGTPVAPIIDVSMPYVAATDGIYQAAIAGTLNPPSNGIGYTLVIDATVAAQPVYHAEEPVFVILDSSPIDLVTLEQTKDWLGISDDNTENDNTLQFLITGFSQYVLNQTGFSSFNSVQTYTEIQDGGGRQRLFVRNPPIQSLVSLQIGSWQVPISTSLTTSGIYIENGGRSIAFRGSAGGLYPPYSIYPYAFIPGQGNVQITYNGGYVSTPYDLGMAAMKAASIYYERGDYQDMASKTLSTGNGSGTIRYRDWSLPPEVNDVISFYSRYARP